MRKFSIEDKLKKDIEKLFKRDRSLYETIMGKIEEIISCQDIDHYKNLRAPLNEFKRVHIRGPFVLVFKYVQPEDKVIFYDMDHHDRIYK